jgi:hypothetical protein
MPPEADQRLDNASNLINKTIDPEQYDQKDAEISKDAQNAEKSMSLNFPTAGMTPVGSDPGMTPVGSDPGMTPEGSDPNANTAPAPATSPDALTADDIVKRLVGDHPELASSPNGNQIIQQLANRLMQGVAPGGEYSQEASQKAQANLDPINASNAFYGKVMNANGIGMNDMTNNQSNFNGNFDKLKAQALQNVDVANKAYSDQLGAQINQSLTGTGDNKTDIGRLFSDLAVKPPEEQWPILMKMSMSPQMKPIADMLLQSPAMKAYVAKSTAQATKSGENAAGAEDTLQTTQARYGGLSQKLDRLEELNSKLPSGWLSPTTDWAAKQSQGLITPDQAAAITEAKTIAAQLQAAEIPVIINGSVRMSKPLLSLMGKGSSIDVAQTPEARAAAINAIRQNIYQSYKQAQEKSDLANGGKAPNIKEPPSYGAKSTPNNIPNNSSNSVPMIKDGKTRMIPRDKVDAMKAQGATVVGG